MDRCLGLRKRAREINPAVRGMETSAQPPTQDLAVRRFSEVNDDPARFQEGVQSYKPFVDGTSLPEVFRDFNDRCTNPALPTFLALIVACLLTWHGKTKSKKQDRRNSASIKLSKAKADLIWLLEFIRDYIRYRRTPLTEEDVEAVVTYVTRFFQNAGRREEVSLGIEILYELVNHADLSPEDLRSILQILTAAARAKETPDHLQKCLKFLITGTLGGLCVDQLFDFLATPTRLNNLKGLSYAKGACKLLSMAIDYPNHSNTSAVQTRRLINALRIAAAQNIFRLNPDILSACDSIIASSKRKADVLALDFDVVISIVVECITRIPQETENEPDRQSSRSISSTDTLAANHVAKIAAQHAQVKAIGAHFEDLWGDLGQHQRVTVADYAIQYPYLSPETLVGICLDFIFAQNLCWPRSTDWSSRLDMVESKFVKQALVSADLRILAITLLKDGLHHDEQTLNDLTEASVTDSNMNVLNTRLLTVFCNCLDLEDDLAVYSELLVAISDLVGNMRKVSNCIETTKEAIEMAIVDTIDELQEHILTKAKTSTHATCAARILVTIFLSLFDSQPKLAVKTAESLIKVAGSECKSTGAKLHAMRLLFRLRSTTSGFIYVKNSPDSEYVAAMLCRTRVTALAFANTPGGQTSSIPANPHSPQLQTPHSSIANSLSESQAETWIYDEEDSLAPQHVEPSTSIRAGPIDPNHECAPFHINMKEWLTQAATCIQGETDWEILSYALVHLGSQLANISLFRNALQAIFQLRRGICAQIIDQTVKPPPAATGLKESDVALCLFNILTPLICYASIGQQEYQKREFGEWLIKAFMMGLYDKPYDGTFRGCVHALAVCSLEIPRSLRDQLYSQILDSMSRVTSKSHLSVHLLEFLSQLAVIPEVHRSFNEDVRKRIFAICIAVLNDRRSERHKQQEAQEQDSRLGTEQPTRNTTHSRQSGMPSVVMKRPPYRAQMVEDVGVPLYASALAYHTMICWFLSLDLKPRAKFAYWITSRLVWLDDQKPMIDPQAEVFRDMMLRTTYSDLGETSPDPTFVQASANRETSDVYEDSREPAAHGGRISSASWLVGYSIVTIETAGYTGRTQITKRQASGTTYATYQQTTRPSPPHLALSTYATPPGNDGSHLSINMLPQHVMLQLQATAAEMEGKYQPIRLPNDKAVSRSLDVFDKIPTIDSHMAGVVYVGPGQSQQAQIMSNTSGAPDFDAFLRGLGFKVSLRPPCGLINHQGLKYPTDGEATIAWCDRVTEMVFLVPTMMPLDVEEEPEWLRRYSFVGNSFVNIIFNDSGLAWSQDTLRSQFNFVNIVITPADRRDTVKTGRQTDKSNAPEASNGNASEQGESSFYKVQVLTNAGFPNISSAADPKILSAEQVSRYVRIQAINACVFSQAWQGKDDETDFHSPWRDRLNAIKKLRERYGGEVGQHETQHGAAAPAGAAAHFAAVGGRRTPVPREDVTAEDRNAFISRLDFAAWMEGKGEFNTQR